MGTKNQDIPFAPPEGASGTWTEWGIRYGNRVLHPFDTKQDAERTMEDMGTPGGQVVCRAVTPWSVQDTPPNAISKEDLDVLIEAYNTLWSLFGVAHWNDGKRKDSCHTPVRYKSDALDALEDLRDFVQGEWVKHGW